MYSYHRPSHGKVEIFCYSFFKHVDSQRCFERKPDVTTNPCFTLDEVIKKLVDKDQDIDVTEVVLQCGFNPIQVRVFWNHIG